MDWFDEEVEALEEQLRRGEINLMQYRQYVREMRQDLQEQQDREDIIAAGRGHLLR